MFWVKHFFFVLGLTPQLPVFIRPADPGFYMVNWLWIGKCHFALGKREEAKPWLEKTVSYETTLEEELEVSTL